jgi:hypothetical protein
MAPRGLGARAPRQAPALTALAVAYALLAPAAAACVASAAPAGRASLEELLGAGHRRTLYVEPSGDLAERLLTIASAAAAARREDVALAIIWPEGGARDFAASWGDLFQAPALPLAPAFPAGCAPVPVASPADWAAARGVPRAWAPVPGGGKALCVAAAAPFVADPRGEAAWFLELLVPAAPVLAAAAPLLDPLGEIQWERWGQWVGLESCSSEACAAAAGGPLPGAADLLAAARALAALPHDGEAAPRFFLAADDAAREAELLATVLALGLEGGPGTALAAPAGGRRRRPRGLEGLRAAALDLYLLSCCRLVVGTRGSARAEAAAAMGGRQLVFAGAAAGA